jgi:hypothetical protein
MGNLSSVTVKINISFAAVPVPKSNIEKAMRL